MARRPDASLTMQPASRRLHHAPTYGFRITIVQRRRQCSRQLVDLRPGNDQWRANKHRVRSGADEKAAIHRALLYQGPYAGGTRQRRATGLVRDNVNRADQPDAPCLADQRMVGKRLQLLLQYGPTFLTSARMSRSS